MIGTATQFKDLFQSADWMKEKHVPVITAPDRVPKGQMFNVSVNLGVEVPHPNTTAHHIEWIDVYFQPRDEKYPYAIGRMRFAAHGASVDGPDTSTVYTHHGGTLNFKTDKPGTIYASALCNIHGLWQSSKELNVE